MASIEVAFRLGGPADVVPIAEMARDYIEPGLGWSWTPRRVAGQVISADTIVLKAMLYGRIAGFATMNFGDEDAHLNLLAVVPELRGKGIGRGLMAWLEKSARVAGILRIHLEVRAGNRGAIAFYRKLGYDTVAMLSGYYQGKEAAVRMTHYLARPFSG